MNVYCILYTKFTQWNLNNDILKCDIVLEINILIKKHWILNPIPYIPWIAINVLIGRI